MPKEILWSLYILGILIAMNLASLIFLLIQNESVSQGLILSLQGTLPAVSLDSIKEIVGEIILRRNIFHAIVIFCWLLLSLTVIYRKNWGRILLVIFTVSSLVGSIYAFSTTDFLTLQVLAVLGWLGRIFLLWFLLFPMASRLYFSQKPVL